MDPSLQQILFSQFGSGASPGGHVADCFRGIVMYGVCGPFEYFHTHLPHLLLSVSRTRWPSRMHAGPDTFLASGVHGFALADLSTQN